MAGNGYGFRYVMKVVGTGIQRCYQRIVYPLPSLVDDMIITSDDLEYIAFVKNCLSD
jgi:hypothetical protein